MAFIYKITNMLNTKVYVGKTERDIETRWKEHLRHVNTYPDIPLYRAIRKYGKENFYIEKIEECDNRVVDEREKYWIAFYDSYHKGYNCTLGGEGSLLQYDEKELEEIVSRYQKGERLDLLCKEFHHKYDAIKARLIKRGIIINTHAGPMKQAKQIMAINPNDGSDITLFSSISEASRAICEKGKNPRAIANHISRYKDTGIVSHGYLWKTIIKEELK